MAQEMAIPAIWEDWLDEMKKNKLPGEEFLENPGTPKSGDTIPVSCLTSSNYNRKNLDVARMARVGTPGYSHHITQGGNRR
jgi:hypothetical protein